MLRIRVSVDGSEGVREALSERARRPGASAIPTLGGGRAGMRTVGETAVANWRNRDRLRYEPARLNLEKTIFGGGE